MTGHHFVRVAGCTCDWHTVDEFCAAGHGRPAPEPDLIRCAYGPHTFPASEASPAYAVPVCRPCAADIKKWGSS